MRSVALVFALLLAGCVGQVEGGPEADAGIEAAEESLCYEIILEREGQAAACFCWDPVFWWGRKRYRQEMTCYSCGGPWVCGPWRTVDEWCSLRC
jgi:hypothetical protein